MGKLSLFNKNELNRINSLINSSNTNFGGEGFIDLLFLLCEKVQGIKVLDTGVAYAKSVSDVLTNVTRSTSTNQKDEMVIDKKYREKHQSNRK